jgi:hypothetical protein
MKVVVHLEIEIEDPADWTTTFGIEGGREIRADIKEYVHNMVADGAVFGNGEVPAKVTLKNP